MEVDMQDEPYLGRQDIVRFPFPYKLWIIINLEYCDFIRWNQDGIVIIINIPNLNSYLSSAISIFNIKGISMFLDHLKRFNFVAVKDLFDKSVIKGELCFQHPYFQRVRLDLLTHVRQLSGNLYPNRCVQRQTETFSMVEMPSWKSIDYIHKRMNGDLCFKNIGDLSEIEVQRMRAEICLEMEHQNRILAKNLQNEEGALAETDNSKQPKRRNGADESVIEIPAEIFENPIESQLIGANNLNGEWNGYFGNVDDAQVQAFYKKNIEHIVSPFPNTK